MKRCSYCGAQNEDESLFCTECGKPIPQSRVCPHCRANVSNDDVFCQNCGKKIIEEPLPASTEPPQDTDTNRNNAYITNGKNLTPHNNSNVNDTLSLSNIESDKEKICTNSNKNILYVFAILFVAIVIGCFWYFHIGDTPDYSLESLAKVVSNYEKVGDFHEGLAMVVKDGKVGYINKYGEEIIPCKYDPQYNNANFSNGFAVVYKDAYYGYIDKSGKEITKIVYANANDFKEGMALVEKAGKKGFIDNNGKEVISLIYDYAQDFSEGLAAVCINDKWGYIDKSGKEVIPLRYSSAGDFSEGLAAVTNDVTCGYIDNMGRIVIPFKFSSGESFSEGVAQVNLNGNHYIDKTGEIISKEYHVTNPIKDGVAVVGRDAKFGLIDKTGMEILPCKYRIVESISEGIVLVYDEGGNALYDKTGKKILDFEYDEGGYTNLFEEGYYIVQKGGKYGYIDKNGNEVIPCIYEEASPFSEGLAIVKIGGVIGVIDKNGKHTFDYNIENESNLTDEIHSEEFIKKNLEDVCKAYNDPNTSEEKLINTYFSKEFKKMYYTINDYERENDSDGPWYSGGFLDGSSEIIDKMAIGQIQKIEENYSSADFVFYCGDSKYIETVKLVLEDGNWFVDDICNRKKEMKDHIEEMTN